MNLKGSKTEEILYKALHEELKASFLYHCFAEVARRDDMVQVADVFEATARNELEHAQHEFEFLGGMSDTLNNIKKAITAEDNEANLFYPKATEISAGEGHTEIADFFRRVSNTEMKHRKIFQDLLSDVQKDNVFTSRTVGHSAVEMAQVMLPEHANPAGFVHGGELMKLMDNAAGVVAARHCGSNVVTGQVEDIKFINSVRVGDLVTVYGKLTFTSRSSMEVSINVETEDLFSGHTGRKVPALTARFIMVALDSDGKVGQVPAMIVSTEAEEVLFMEGQERYKSRKGDISK